MLQLACKNDLDQRGLEFMELLANPQLLNLGTKYAMRQNKRLLAEKLTQLAERMMEEDDLDQSLVNYSSVCILYGSFSLIVFLFF